MEQEEKQFLSLPKIDVYIPSKPVSVIEEYDFNLPPRNFIIQGETLEFFVIIRLAELFNHKLSQNNTEKKGESNASTEDPTSQSAPTQHVPTSIEDDSNRIELDTEAFIKKPLFKEKLIRMFNNLEIRTEFMRINSKWEPSNFGKTTNSQLSKISPVSPDEALNIFMSNSFNTESETIFDPIILPNGDILYYLTTDVCMKKRHIGQQIVLAVVMLPPSQPISINDLISPSYVESRNVMRMVPCRLRLVQPLWINIEKNLVNGNNLTSVSIENRHEEDIIIESVDINIVQTKEWNDKDTGRFEDYMDVVYDQTDFPLSLKENEQYNFVVSFERKPVPVSKKTFDVLNTSIPEVHILWSTVSMCGKMLSPVKLPQSLPSKKKLLITFDTEISPIKLHSIFPLRITVTNLSEKPRDIILEVTLPELDREHDKFFFLSLRKTTAENLPITPRNMSSAKLNSSLTISSNSKSIGEERSPTAIETTDSVEDLINLRNVFSDTTDLLSKYEQSRKQVASIFCLEKIFRLGHIEPRGQSTITLECIAMRVGLFSIKNIKIFDQLTNKAYVLQETCEILVVPNG